MSGVPGPHSLDTVPVIQSPPGSLFHPFISVVSCLWGTLTGWWRGEPSLKALFLPWYRVVGSKTLNVLFTVKSFQSLWTESSFTGCTHGTYRKGTVDLPLVGCERSRPVSGSRYVGCRPPSPPTFRRRPVRGRRRRSFGPVAVRGQTLVWGAGGSESTPAPSWRYPLLRSLSYRVVIRETL